MPQSEIHISDVRTFLSCRRKWDYSSMLRKGLEPQETPIHFLVGRAVHASMYALYELGMNPVDAYDAFIGDYIKTTEPSLAVPDDKSIRYQQVKIGRMVCGNYLKWITSTDAPDEDWITVANEPPFHLPLYNEDGKLSRRIGLGGRFDRVAQKRSDGTYWLWEYKTTSRKPEEIWMEMDNQVTTYCYAAQQILGVPISGIHFRFMIKKGPEKPHRIRGGSQLSRAINSGTQGVNTTYELYIEAIEELANEQLMQEGKEMSETNFRTRVARLMAEYDDVLTQLAARGWEEYFVPIDVVKTQTQIKSAVRDLWAIGLEMCRPTVRIYPTPEWMKCKYCQFREPCKIADAQGIAESEKYLSYVYTRRDPEKDYDLDNLFLGEEG